MILRNKARLRAILSELSGIQFAFHDDGRRDRLRSLLSEISSLCGLKTETQNYGLNTKRY